MRHPFCLIRAIWRSIYCMELVSGCDFVTDDEPTPENVHALRCKTCGKVSIGWSWSSLENIK